MIKVKISLGWWKPLGGLNAYSNDLPIFNFTNTNNNIYNNKHYYINSEIEDPDFWFIIENTRKTKLEKVNISNSRIFFLNSETRYDDRYFFKSSSDKFLKQFDFVYSPYDMKVKVYNTTPFLLWRLRGDPFEDIFEESDVKFYKNFNPQKEKLLSVYCTDKVETETQKLRLEFVKKLKILFGNDIDWFGYDIKTKNKQEGIAKYKYHLVLENQLKNNFISEKLFDSFLGNSYPIYAGAPNVNDYFSKNSITNINLHDFDESINKIENCINSELYRKNFSYIEESKNVVLNKFNLIKRIDSIVENYLTKIDLNSEKNTKIIYPKIYFESKSFTQRIIYALKKRKNYLTKIFK